MATTTNYSWSTPDDTALVKDGAAAIRSLGTAIDTTVFNNAGAAIAKTIVDAKGDIIAATAADTVARLAYSGTNGDLLTVDTSTATGLKWATPAAAGGMTLISETVASANSSVTFSSIPATYKQLLLIITGLVIDGTSTSQQIFSLKVNSLDSIYVNQRTTVNDTGTSVRFDTDTHLEFFCGVTTTTLHNSVNGYVLIDNYASTTKLKNYTCAKANQDRHNGVLNTQSWQGFFNTTAAIDTVAIVRQIGTGNLSNLANTSVRLYGVS